MTFVYIITAEDREAPCKIGLSEDPWVRIKALQTGSPDRLVVREAYDCGSRQDAERVEMAFHDANAEHRGIGEWFSLSFDAANYWLWRVVDLPNIERWQARQGT